MSIRTAVATLLKLSTGVLMALFLACAGSGNGGLGTPAPVVSPSALTYGTNPAVYTLGQAIPLNTPSHGGGAVDAYTATPTLPAGLSLNGTSGAISGTPTAIVSTVHYTVTATNSGGSTPATLAITVNDLPPTNLHYTTPSPTYTVGTTISPNFATQDGGAVTGYSVSPALPTGLTFNTVTAAITGTPSAPAALATYTVTATNSGGSTTVSIAITINAAPDVAPAFTTQPADQSVTAPATATFIAVATGSPAPTLQWQRSNNGGASWSDLVGFTSSGYTIPATTGTDNGAQFRVVATNTAGSLASAAATLSVASAGKAWAAGERIGPASGGIYEPPQIRFDGLGNAMAVWIQEVFGVAQRDLWANRYMAGTGWGTPQIIVPGVGTRMGRVQFGMSADGKALAVWEMMDDPYAPMAHIWSISYAPGTGWGTATGIDNDTYPNQSGSPKLAVAANGTAVVAWDQGDSLTVINVCMATGHTSTGWVSSPTVLATGPLARAGQVSTPDVILNAQGFGFAFWQYFDGTNFLLTAAPISGGTVGTPQEISANTGALSNPHAAANASGTAVVAWEQRNGNRFEITSNRYVPGTGWGSPTQVNNPTSSGGGNPQIFLDDAGTATALWVDGTGPFWNHQTALGWGSAELITYPYRVVGNSAGQLLGARFYGQNLYASPAYPTSAADWGAGTLLTSTGYIPLEMAMDSSGNSLTVWIEPVAGGYALFGSLYR